MKNPDKAARLRRVVETAPKNCLVYVSAKYATHFQSPPRDGRTYWVQDPRQKTVIHCTKPDGTYVRMDSKAATGKLQAMRLEVNMQGSPFRSRKRIVAASVQYNGPSTEISDEAQRISLIDINKVMKICGFSRSFIHERADFPKPFRLGSAQRSASRWSEAEVVAWVKKLMSTRGDQE